MVIALACASVFVSLRVNALGGNPSSFVVAGHYFSHPGSAPRSLVIIPHSYGYDGEFYYRLALDPFTTKRTAHGITLDTPAERQGRILYPLLAWLGGTGNPTHIAWAMIAINIGAISLLGLLGGILAKDNGLHALWGLGLPAFPATLLILARDLTDLTTVALLVAGLILLRRRRPIWAATALTLATFAKETTMVVVVAVGLVWAREFLWVGWQLARREWKYIRTKRPAPPPPVAHRSVTGAGQWCLLGVPLIALAGWQAILHHIWGTGSYGRGHLAVSAPLAPVTSAANHAVNVASTATSGQNILPIATYAFLAAFGVAVVFAILSRKAMPWERLAFIVAAIVALTLSNMAWNEAISYLRTLAPLYALGVVVLLGSRYRAASLFLFAAAGLLSIWYAVPMVTGTP
jgi:hypothetical protein